MSCIVRVYLSINLSQSRPRVSKSIHINQSRAPVSKCVHINHSLPVCLIPYSYKSVSSAFICLFTSVSLFRVYLRLFIYLPRVTMFIHISPSVCVCVCAYVCLRVCVRVLACVGACVGACV